ncbi:MAG: hypothetical protein DSM106950_05185 [Stigonema ocellatum SAG 48.90 = DSM 106950]|nr:hypothetical protein [Stigonema ocellatum SAG 48.90 = DSM 106950]
MFHYLVKYADQDGAGKTTITSPVPIDADLAAEAITEQLTKDDMSPEWVHIDEFAEIKNPLFGIYVEMRRLCDRE